MTIFSMSIRYLREHHLKMVHNQTCGVEETDIQYVLTVPAIWNDKAKQFMRESAEKAEIDTNRLKLALEPEVASIWCQTVTTDARGALSFPGTSYMVVDLGGGTVDISVHEKKIDGTLKELHHASGGPWGGMYVNLNYLKWLATLYGQEALDRLKREEMADYLDILRGFETKKRSISSCSNDMINFRIPASLQEFSEERKSITLQERLCNLKLDKFVSIKRFKMRVDPAIIKEWFNDPVGACIREMRSILLKRGLKGVNTILLVGGFGESSYVQEKIRSAFSYKRIIVPEEAGIVVLKGSVRFGHKSNIISSRIMKNSYGVKGIIAFDETTLSPTHKRIVDGREKVCDAFDPFVKAGQTIETGCPVTKEYEPSDMNETCLRIYCSVNPEPKYTTDVSCKLLGNLTIKHEDGAYLVSKAFDASLSLSKNETI